jgi:broad specificity phosphatase PhoE
LGIESDYAVLQMPSLSLLNIVLVRHGESNNNIIYDEVRSRLGQDVSEEVLAAEEERLRSSDPDLSLKGLAQAQRLGEFISSSGGVFCGQSLRESWQVYSSPMARALQTSQGMLDASGDLLSAVKVKVHPELYESGGCYKGEQVLSGSTKTEVELKYPTFECIEGMDKGWFAGRTSHETTQEFLQRMDRIAEWLFERQSDVILVIHGNLMNGLINRLLMGSAGNQGQGGTNKGGLYIHNNTGFSHIQIYKDDSGARVTCVQAINRVDHLLALGDSSLLTGNRPYADHWVQEYLPTV